MIVNFFSIAISVGLGWTLKVYKKCMSRPKIIDVNSNEPVFYPCSIKVNTCSGSCNNINDPYTKLCAPDIIKNIHFKVSNLMSRQIIHIKQDK